MKTPNPTECILLCLNCHAWQLDITPRAVSELGGIKPALRELAAVAGTQHDCVNAGGRIKWSDGTWREAPPMSGGETPTGVLGAFPLPRWWVWR